MLSLSCYKSLLRRWQPTNSVLLVQSEITSETQFEITARPPVDNASAFNRDSKDRESGCSLQPNPAHRVDNPRNVNGELKESVQVTYDKGDECASRSKERSP